MLKRLPPKKEYRIDNICFDDGVYTIRQEGKEFNLTLQGGMIFSNKSYDTVYKFMKSKEL